MTDLNHQRGWGGTRPGAGRKPKPKQGIADAAINQLIKEFRAEGHLAGSNAARELARLAYRSADEKIRLKALTAYFTFLAEKKVHHVVEQQVGPTIMLPPLNAKPVPPKNEDLAEERLH